MFTINEYVIKFHHHDNFKKGKKRKRLTTCTILDKDTETLLAIGYSQCNESDAKINLPYNKGFARRQSLKRALKDFNQHSEFNFAVWKEYFDKVSIKERNLLK